MVERERSSDFPMLLWTEMENAGLLIHGFLYEECRRTVWDIGTCLHRALRLGFGERYWDETFTSLGNSVPDNHIRILGVGHVLTEFAIAPLGPLPEPAKREVCELGALSNFIVALYDQLLDLNQYDYSILSRTSLSAALENADVSELSYKEDSLPAGLLAYLVTIYVRRARRLSNGESAPDGYVLTRAILDMYDAEFETLRAPLAVSRKILHRKAALPFVVMGIPAWFAHEAAGPAIRSWHLRWLYGLGSFFGWVDDAIDEGQDREAGRPNAVAKPARILTEPDPSRQALARQIAGYGERTMREWRERLGGVEIPPHVTHAVALTLVSWFGGLAPDA
jgi:hypothetical protein